MWSCIIGPQGGGRRRAVSAGRKMPHSPMTLPARPAGCRVASDPSADGSSILIRLRHATADLDSLAEIAGMDYIQRGYDRRS
ncbi:hypothetical protein HJFPF1_00149 [Paramyrothecium foliicola]|nr:hypothetical protein HJFPF1_00149 [Paramyrothecium foliicola]